MFSYIVSPNQDWESYFIKVKLVIVAVTHKVTNRYNFRYFFNAITKPN